MTRSADRRSRSNRNDRGSSYQRRRRREWLVEEYGDGEFVACFLQRSPHCLYVLDKDNVSPDRVVLGVDGGTYRRSNILPACYPCQCDQGGEVGVRRRAELAAARLMADHHLTPTTVMGYRGTQQGTTRQGRTPDHEEAPEVAGPRQLAQG